MSLVLGVEANQGGASPWEEKHQKHVCGQMNVSEFPKNLTLKPNCYHGVYLIILSLYLLHRYTEKYSTPD